MSHKSELLRLRWGPARVIVKLMNTTRFNNGQVVEILASRFGDDQWVGCEAHVIGSDVEGRFYDVVLRNGTELNIIFSRLRPPYRTAA